MDTLELTERRTVKPSRTRGVLIFLNDQEKAHLESLVESLGFGGTQAQVIRKLLAKAQPADLR